MNIWGVTSSSNQSAKEKAPFWLAFSELKKVATSTNGLNFTSRTDIPSSAFISAAGIGGNKAVFVPGSGQTSYVTSDGINYTSGTLPVSAWWFHCVYGNGYYIAGVTNAGNNSQAARSTNGINWESITMPINSQNWSKKPVYHKPLGRIFYATYQGNWASTVNGSSWQTGSLGVGANDNSWNMSTSPDYVWGVATQGTSRVIYSSNGTSWSSASLPASDVYGWARGAYGNGRYVVVGGLNRSAWSTDLVNWNSVTLPGGNTYTWADVIWTGTYFVAFAGSMNSYSLMAYSTDGTSWTSTSMPTSSTWIGVGNLSTL